MRANNGKNRKKTIRINIFRYIFIVLPLACILTFVIWNFYFVGVKASYSIVECEESRVVNIASKFFIQIFSNVQSDLFVLADSLNSYNGNYSETDIDHISQRFLFFSKRKNIYDQIRFLDAYGMEKIRVNFNEGQPKVVSNDALQDKSKRYYFEKSINLKSDDVYLSGFDLNIEKGIVERPEKIIPNSFLFNRVWRLHKAGEYVKPMIRWCMPIVDSSEKKRGVLVLNYFGEHLLRIFEDITSSSYGESALVDHKGYWLKGFNKEAEWGFLKELKGVDNLRLQDEYPQVWDIISRKEAGQFYTDDGLFTFNTVYPLSGKYFLSLSGDAYIENSKVETSDYLWKAFTFVSKAKLNEKISDLEKKSLFIYVLLLCFIFIAAFLFVQIDEKRKLFEQGEKDLFATLANEKKREAQELALLNEQLVKNEQGLNLTVSLRLPSFEI